MNTPYTQAPFDAFVAAEQSVALAISALVLSRSTWRWPTRALLVLATWLAVLAPSIPAFWKSIGGSTDLTTLQLVEASALLVTIGVVASMPKKYWVVAVLGEGALYYACKKITDSDLELIVLHHIWIGAFVGLEAMRQYQPSQVQPLPRARAYVAHDLAMFATAVLLGGLVSTYVLHRACDSADEWAYTYQAAVFARGHAYGATPPDCYEAFRMFWVFHVDDRMFSQYTPGWPLFMAPFVALKIVWLAGPASFGLLVVGLARVARRLAAGTVDWARPSAAREVHAAGTIAAVTAMLASTLLINAGSRFSHIFVCALFAWSIEALCVITSRPSRREEIAWGALLGCAASWMLATRPTDGGALGIGLFAYFVRALLKRRVSLRALLWTLATFTVGAAFTLVILRLQLGQWFKTGYSLTGDIYTWARLSASIPKPNEIRWSVPLATGSYCWWPLAPALGVAGLFACVRGAERRVVFMLVVSESLIRVLYALIEYGRDGFDFGYGPRYAMTSIVPMSIGGAVILAPLVASALSRDVRASALTDGGPMAVWAAAVLLGFVRIAPLVYPYNYQDVHARSSVFEEAKKQHLSDAIVWIAQGATSADSLDLTQNYPLELYPSPPVIFLRDVPEMRACVKKIYPARASYRAQGHGNVSITRD